MSQFPMATAVQSATIDAPVDRVSLPDVAARPWRIPLTVFALVAAALAVWITASADFLAYPGWLAAQKADFILGPIGVGLYWMHFRPANRLGPWLIALGLLAIPYVLESARSPWPFTIG